MINLSDIRAAEHIVDHSGAVKTLSEGMRTDRRGRKDDPNKLRLLLIGLVLCVLVHGQAVVTAVHELLTNELPLDEQLRLGVCRVGTAADGTATTWALPIADLYELTAKLNTKLGYGLGKHPDLGAEERARRHRTIVTCLDDLMDVFDLGWQSEVFAMDATGIWSWGRGKAKAVSGRDDGADEHVAAATGAGVANAARTRQGATGTAEAAGPGEEAEQAPGEDEIVLGDPTSHDPDGAWGVKTAKIGGEQRYYGYSENTLVQVPGAGQAADDEPRLIVRLELQAANADVVDVSLSLIDRFNAARQARLESGAHVFAVAGAQHVGDLVVDRHYHYKDFQRWWAELYGRGVSQHLTLREDEQGFTEGNGDRLRWAAGAPHCPCTPDDLGTITRPSPSEPRAKHVAFDRRLERRQAYALRRITSFDANGTHRVQCPALAGSVGCALREGTLAAAHRLGLPIVATPPDADLDGEPLPACCTQSTVTVTPPTKVRKLLQPHYWGSSAWKRCFDKRTYVEGTYGNRKNVNTENMRRGQFRFTGIALVNLVVGLSAACYNLRIIRNWHERTGMGDPTHPLLARPEPDYGFVRLSELERDALMAQYRTNAA